MSVALQTIRSIPRSQGAQHSRQLTWKALRHLEREHWNLPLAQISEVVVGIKDQIKDACVKFTDDDKEEFDDRLLAIHREVQTTPGLELTASLFNGA